MEDETIHFRHVILYEFRKEVSAATAHKNIQEVYLDRAPNLRTVKEWFAKFRNDDFDVEDKPRSGGPSATDDDIMSDLVEKNPNITIEEITKKMKVENSAAAHHLMKLGFTLKRNKWVPYSPADRNKLKRLWVDVMKKGLNELNGKVTSIHRVLQTYLHQVFVCFVCFV